MESTNRELLSRVTGLAAAQEKVDVCISVRQSCDKSSCHFATMSFTSMYFNIFSKKIFRKGQGKEAHISYMRLKQIERNNKQLNIVTFVH